MHVSQHPLVEVDKEHLSCRGPLGEVDRYGSAGIPNPAAIDRIALVDVPESDVAVALVKDRRRQGAERAHHVDLLWRVERADMVVVGRMASDELSLPRTRQVAGRDQGRVGPALESRVGEVGVEPLESLRERTGARLIVDSKFPAVHVGKSHHDDVHTPVVCRDRHEVA